MMIIVTLVLCYNGIDQLTLIEFDMRLCLHWENVLLEVFFLGVFIANITLIRGIVLFACML